MCNKHIYLNLLLKLSSLATPQALSFMFEYIGELAKDYIYAVTPLLEDALMDRDLVGVFRKGFTRRGEGCGTLI